LSACGLKQQPGPPETIAGIAAGTDRDSTSPQSPTERVDPDGAIAPLAGGAPLAERSDDPAIALLHSALVHLTLEDTAALDANYQQVRALDRERTKRGEPETDLADQTGSSGPNACSATRGTIVAPSS
jgi:hypothetical protein